MSDPEPKIIEVGSRVTIKMGEKIRVLTIVTPKKVNTEIGAISYESPLGKALMKFSKGDIVSYKNPIGQLIYVEIIEIE